MKREIPNIQGYNIKRLERQILVETIGEHFLGRYKKFQTMQVLSEYQKYEFDEISNILKKTGLLTVVDSI